MTEESGYRRIFLLYMSSDEIDYESGGRKMWLQKKLTILE